MDIAFPKENEKKFLEIAKKLDIKITFAYLFKGNFKVDNILLSDKGTRKNFEDKQIKMFFDLENLPGKDSLHQRKSGLNQILAKIAHEKGKVVCFNFSAILKASDEKRALILGRMRQNVKLCRKYKVKMFIGTFASEPYELRGKYELRAFGFMLGMSPREVKESLQFK